MLMMSLHASYVVAICRIYALLHVFFLILFFSRSFAVQSHLHQFCFPHFLFGVAFLLDYSIFIHWCVLCVFVLASEYMDVVSMWWPSFLHIFFSLLWPPRLDFFLCKSSFKMLCTRTHTLDRHSITKCEWNERKKLFYKKGNAKMRKLRGAALACEVVRWCVRCDGLNIIFDLFFISRPRTHTLFALPITHTHALTLSYEFSHPFRWYFVFRARVLSLNTISTEISCIFCELLLFIPFCVWSLFLSHFIFPPSLWKISSD